MSHLVHNIGMLFILSYREKLGADRSLVHNMTRNTPNILPFCRNCGEYKGLGPCRNPDCKEIDPASTEKLNRHRNRCVICGDLATHHCFRCGMGYCDWHSKNMTETRLVDIEQHLGTCTVCGEIVCEQCWIFNNLGLVTCQAHNLDMKTVD
jgi:hypothetical protein